MISKSSLLLLCWLIDLGTTNEFDFIIWEWNSFKLSIGIITWVCKDFESFASYIVFNFLSLFINKFLSNFKFSLILTMSLIMIELTFNCNSGFVHSKSALFYTLRIHAVRRTLKLKWNLNYFYIDLSILLMILQFQIKKSPT